MILLELFFHFALISMLAFGGGNAAISLLERVSVDEMRWVTPQDFAAAIGFAYITPGPVLITSAFIGYRAAGLLGATVATIGVFLIPWVLSVLASYQVRQYIQHPWLQGFGLGAAPAVIGLLGITVFALGHYAFSDWLYWVIAALALGLSLFTKVSPILILIAGTAFGGFGRFFAGQLRAIDKSNDGLESGLSPFTAGQDAGCAYIGPLLCPGNVAGMGAK